MATEIKYNGSTIASLEAGQTVRLNCEGKKMADDVHIIIPKVVDPLAGTWILNDVLNKPDITTQFKAIGRMTTYGKSIIMAEFTWGLLHNNTNSIYVFSVSTMSNKYPGYDNNYSNKGDVWIRYYSQDYTMTSSKTMAYSGTDYAKLEITSSLAESENGEALLTWLQANARKL